MGKQSVQFPRLAGRILGATALIALVILLFGYFQGWKEPVQFSNTFFWAGVLLIIFDVLSVTGGFVQRADLRITYAETAGQANITERNQRWAADITKHSSSMIFPLITGLLLIGIAVAISQLLVYR
jgi:heme A synthase